MVRYSNTTPWRRIESSDPRQGRFAPRRNSTRHSLDGGWVGPRDCLDAVG